MELLFDWSVVGVVFALGAAIGSFINVVVYRLPRRRSLLYPPSACPHCQHRLSWRDNVPILGWLWLKGRCRYCKAPISPRYLLVEAVTGFLFVLVFGLFGLSWQMLGYWVFFSWLLALSLIDLDTMTLPEALTRSGLLLGFGFQAGLGWLQAGWVGALKALVASAIAAVLGIWLVELIVILGSMALGQSAMGWGDAKLAAMLGAWLGWQFLLLAGFLACAVGSIVGGVAIAMGWLGRRQPMPFGPFLALGAILAVVWGEALLSTYLKIFFPAL
jgi:leader peptidase (prepilin peptidase)/N-methyltransferase